MNPLSPCEYQVAELIAFGATEKEIANHLRKSIHTIRAQKRHIFEKTSSRNIADVTRWYIQERSGVHLTPSIRIKIIIASLLLCLIIIAEATQKDFCRIRTRAKRTTSRRVEARTRRSKDYELKLIAA